MYHADVTTGFRIHGNSLTVTGSRNPEDFRSQMQTVLDRHLGKVPRAARRGVESRARAAIAVNVSLATAAAGSWKNLVGAAWQILSLGPVGTMQFLRDTRLKDRLLPRLRAKMSGAL
jgi:hypothetical protein